MLLALAITFSKPSLSMRRKAEAEILSLRNLFSSVDQSLLVTILGKKRRGVFPVTFRPIPFFFFAIPRMV
ncbi:hypothetical protein CP02DC23_0185 [Chlamydia psittaci 02DC23]|nr:hypothetical protein CP02DC23_0185 [Chlamydia psittaci 02DC23]